MEKAGQGKKKLSLMATLLMLAIVPTLATALAVTTFACVELNGVLEEGIYDSLYVAANDLKSYYEWDIINNDDHMPVYEHDYVDSLLDQDIELTLFVNNVRYITSIRDPENPTGRNEGTTSGDAIWAQVSKGQQFNDKNVMINGEKYFVTYLPLKDADGKVIGMAFAGKPQNVVEAKLAEAIIKLVVTTDLMALVCCVAAGLVARKLKEILLVISVNLKRLSEGNLKPSKTAKSTIREIDSIIESRIRLSDVLQQLAQKMQKVSGELLTGGTELQYAADSTSSNANEISRAVEGISQGSVSMAADIERASGSVSNMGDRIEDIVASVDELDSEAGAMEQAGHKALEIIKKLDSSNEKTTEAINIVADNVEATDRSVGQIASAVTLITEIADQTNLLALNASIEAARAGEAGRGFAVVANEISSLAAQSNDSAKKIENILQSLVEDSKRSIGKMAEVRVLLNEQQENLKDTEREFANVEGGIQNTKAQSGSVNNKAKQCDEARQEVIDIIASLSAIAQENAASTEETNAAMEELNATINLVAKQAEDVKGQAESLKESIAFFKL